MELLDLVVYLVLLVLLANAERSALVVPVVLQVHLVKEAHPEEEVFPVLMDPLALKVRPVIEDLQAPMDPREKLETLVVLVLLVCKVFVVYLAELDLQASPEALVNEVYLVRMVKMANKDHKVSKVSLDQLVCPVNVVHLEKTAKMETQDQLVNLVLEVIPVKMVLLVPPARLDPLVLMVSVVLLVQLVLEASKDCLVLLEPPETLAKMEKLVFKDPQVYPVHLVLEANVDSPVNVALLVLLVPLVKEALLA